MIEVLSIPPVATIQDLGREGYRAQGLGAAGAMDPMAHRLANMLLGNPETAATLEIPLTPARFEFTADTGFALAGAACGATLDGVALPRMWAGRAHAGQRLTLGALQDGARVYLALPGGIDVPLVLGSRATQLREGFGGYQGRALLLGDRLAGVSPGAATPRGMSCAVPPLRAPGEEAIRLRVLPSAETTDFSDTALQDFFATPYEITPQSNRQGYRLHGAPLERMTQDELRSHGIAPGIIQVPGGGQPIIQLADAATMGGYPKIACVIEEDLWRLGQAGPGDTVVFERIDHAQAREIEQSEAQSLAATRQALAHARALQDSWR